MRHDIQSNANVAIYLAIFEIFAIEMYIDFDLDLRMGQGQI